MVNYNKGKIYKLCCKDINVKEIYIGSTCNELKCRKRQHKSNSNNNNSKKYNLNVYQYIRDNGGWNNWDMVLIEEYKECNNKLELHKKERYYIEQLKATLNSLIPSRSDKEYRENNKKYYEDWRKNNKETIKENNKEWREDNKEKIKEKKKEYHLNNKEKIAEKRKQRYEKNKKEISEKAKQKFNCECGGKYTLHHRARHFRTKKHIEFLENN